MMPERQYRRENGYHEHARHYEPTTEEKVERDPSLLANARDHIAELDLSIQSLPSVQQARILQVESFPTWCGDRKVHDLRITEGQPMHGEKRSDDHIGRFDVEAPVRAFDVDLDVIHEEATMESGYAHNCAECGHGRFRYRYNANHFIAGSEKLYCPACETVVHSEEWG